MSTHRNDVAVRMGPTAVITLLVVIALATLSVLSLTTAYASQTAAAKQDDAVRALYANEVQAQEFLAQTDGQLLEMQGGSVAPEAAAEAVCAKPFAEGAHASGRTIEAAFQTGFRTLTVTLEIQDDLTYQITSWKTASNIDTSEQITLWNGN